MEGQLTLKMISPTSTDDFADFFVGRDREWCWVDAGSENSVL